MPSSSPSPSEAATLDYIQMSNQNNFMGIACLLAPDVSYPPLGSTRKEVIAGQRQFRIDFPRVWWRQDELRHIGEKEVEYSFERWWTDANTGVIKMCRAAQIVSWRAIPPEEHDGPYANAHGVWAQEFRYCQPPGEITDQPAGYPPGAEPKTFSRD